MSITSEEIKEFTTITHSFTGTKRESALFNLLGKLLEENHSLIQSYHVITINTELRSAYLVELKESPPIALFTEDNYQYKESHITIDKFYTENLKKSIAGYSYVHYTAVYQSANIERVVHVYFNRQGQYLSTHIKEGTDTYLPIGVYLENQIKNNSFIASKFLWSLLHEKAKRYLDAVNAAEKIEKDLAKTFVILDTVEKEGYIKLAEKFIEKIQEINFYNELEEDCRDISVRSRIKSLRTKISAKIIEIDHVEKKEEFETDGINQVNKLENEEILPKRLDRDLVSQPSLQKLTQEIMTLESKLDKLNLKNNELRNQIDIYEVSDKLKIVLFELSCLGSKGKELTRRIEGKLKNIPKLNALFDICISSGKIVEFKELFAVRGIDFAFCERLISAMVCNKNRDLLQHQIEICNFLFSNSELYRQFIIMKRKDFKLFGEELGMSFLGQTVKEENLDVFRMLLEHGYDPNGLGFYYNKKDISVLRVVIHIRDNIEYVKLLLQYGASVNRQQKVVDHLIENTYIEMQRDKKEQTLIKAIPGKGRFAAFDKTATIPELLLACKLEKYSFIPYLQEKSELWEIATACSLISENFRSHLLLCGIAGVVCASGVQSADTMSDEFTKQGVGLKDRMLFIIYPRDKDNSSSIEMEVFRMLTDALRERYKKNMKMVNGVISNLESLAKNETNKIEAHVFYKAILFLMAQKSPLDDKDTQRVVQVYSKIAMLFYNSKDQTEMQHSLEMLRRASWIGKESSYKEFIQETPVFKFALKKLQDAELPLSNPLVFSNALTPAISKPDQNEVRNKERPSKHYP